MTKKAFNHHKNTFRKLWKSVIGHMTNFSFLFHYLKPHAFNINDLAGKWLSYRVFMLFKSTYKGIV